MGQNEEKTVKIKLDARGGVVLWEDWCAAWTGVSQSMGRRRRESSAFDWSVRPPGYAFVFHSLVHPRSDSTRSSGTHTTTNTAYNGNNSNILTAGYSLPNGFTVPQKDRAATLRPVNERVEAKSSMSPALSSSQAVLTRASNQLAKDLDSNEAIIKDILGLSEERRESKEDINTLRVKVRRSINELNFRMNNVQAALDKYNAAVDQLGASAASDRTEMDKVEEVIEKTLDLLDRAQDQKISLIHCYDEVDHSQTKFTSNAGHNAPRANLPPIPIPKFRGQVWEWEAFWGAFNQTVHSQDMDDYLKMNYFGGCHGRKGENICQTVRSIQRVLSNGYSSSEEQIR
ncbi:hypothetical protein KIN20_017263 [Parelaphostrongylus tenuis]|uniref:Uncharacterized protein n=1 Tax=Parelaphostrongylus tenuis TaxID=148309 RepID=A0AAD5MHQ4_PARTN|nr:hypothetical protein KIN20_017263 [Parelaphostrongylus tenuis]